MTLLIGAGVFLYLYANGAVSGKGAAFYGAIAFLLLLAFDIATYNAKSKHKQVDRNDAGPTSSIFELIIVIMVLGVLYKLGVLHVVKEFLMTRFFK